MQQGVEATLMGCALLRSDETHSRPEGETT